MSRFVAVVLVFAGSLSFLSSANAAVVVGTTIDQAQTNCNIAMLGKGQIRDCSWNPNGTVTCACYAVDTGGQTCNTAIGVGYQGARSNCTLQTNGAGRVYNCSWNQNGTVLCSCCY